MNNDLNFTYRDGSCDEAAFVKDGIHLSAHGVSKLLSNVSLSQPQKTATSRTTTNRPTSRQGPPSKKTRDACVNRPRNGPAASTARRSVSRNTPAEPAWHIVGQCRLCGETNHVTKKCRHEVAVTLLCLTDGLNINTRWTLPVILGVNARSLSIEKADELLSISSLNDVSCVCVTETWFKDFMTDESVGLSG